jgi:hypothetical protein
MILYMLIQVNQKAFNKIITDLNYVFYIRVTVHRNNFF